VMNFYLQGHAPPSASSVQQPGVVPRPFIFPMHPWPGP
jgi:hypothetical protein